MTTNISIRARWKKHERAVAKYFGTTRNVCGRGEEGFTGSDVVVDIAGTASFYLPNPKSYTHIFVECKYTFGDESMPFKIMKDACKGTNVSHPKNKGKTAILSWGPYILCYLDESSSVVCHATGCGVHSVRHDCFSFGVYQCNRLVPKYLDEWWDQVIDDIEGRDTDKIRYTPLPLVCLGNSSKKRIIVYKALYPYAKNR